MDDSVWKEKFAWLLFTEIVNWKQVRWLTSAAILSHFFAFHQQSEFSTAFLISVNGTHIPTHPAAGARKLEVRNEPTLPLSWYLQCIFRRWLPPLKYISSPSTCLHQQKPKATLISGQGLSITGVHPTYFLIS